MNMLALLDRSNRIPERIGLWLSPLLLLALRLWMPWQFFKTGLVKVSN